jgi:hypothetical protein
VALRLDEDMVHFSKHLTPFHHQHGSMPFIARFKNLMYSRPNLSLLFIALDEWLNRDRRAAKI